MLSKPKISVVMPSYGKADFIGEAIESVLGQTFDDLELIVVDDCSADGSLGIAEAYAKRDPRVRVILKPSRTGVSNAKNVGIKSAQGEAITILDADDVYSPDNLQKLWARMKLETVPTIVYSDHRKIDAEGNVLLRTKPPHACTIGWIIGDLLTRGFGHVTTTLIPMVCFDKVGLFDESLKWSEDYDLALRFAREFPFTFVPEQLYGHRVYPGNMRNAIARNARFNA